MELSQDNDFSIKCVQKSEKKLRKCKQKTSNKDFFTKDVKKIKIEKITQIYNIKSIYKIYV